MYKQLTSLSLQKIFLVGISAFLFLSHFAAAETPIRSATTLKIAHDIWYYNYTEAIENSAILIQSEPFNPVGYFILGTTYQNLSEAFRNDRYKDSIALYLDSAITLANGRKTVDPDNGDWYFISGASYGYRALLRAFHGDWLGAFRDGWSCTSGLNRALELDSTLYDAYLGLGSYHYYRTIKAKDFLWLPFVSDQRAQGIAEIKIAIAHGYLASYNAREALLRVYFTEGRYEDGVALVDSLTPGNPHDPYRLLYEAQCLIGLGRLDEADECVRQLRMVWKSSPYFDPFGLYEAEYLSAEIFLKHGDKETAKKIVNKIIADKKMGRANAYYLETLDKAEALAPSLR
jgi:tetratricopeptide (TPR) repeat protein